MSLWLSVVVIGLVACGQAVWGAPPGVVETWCVRAASGHKVEWSQDGGTLIGTECDTDSCEYCYERPREHDRWTRAVRATWSQQVRVNEIRVAPHQMIHLDVSDPCTMAGVSVRSDVTLVYLRCPR